MCRVLIWERIFCSGCLCLQRLIDEPMMSRARRRERSPSGVTATPVELCARRVMPTTASSWRIAMVDR
jgi:hypothetical protein